MPLMGIARMGDPIYHDGVSSPTGTIVSTVNTTVMCEGKPVACVGDVVTCSRHSPPTFNSPNLIVAGDPKVLIGKTKLPAAVGSGVSDPPFLGSMTTCGAYILTTTLKTKVKVG